MSEIPFVDLKAQYAAIRDEVNAAMAQVLADCAFIQGPAVTRFEQAFAARLGVQHCIGCSSGTSALSLALEAAGIGPGDEVITVAHTFFATAEAILGRGATPVFVDIDPDTHTMDPMATRQAVTPKTRALIPVHLYGGPCAMTPLLEIAREYGMVVIEDAAQAHLARYEGRLVGSLGDAACFSFYPGKNLGAYGDAGAVTTNTLALADRMRLMRDHGRQGKYSHVAVGSNERMDGIQGAVLAAKLPHLDAWTTARRRLAACYQEHLAPLGVKTVRPVDGGEPVYHLYVIELPDGVDRARVQTSLHQRGIATGVHYPVPCHRQPALCDRGLPPLPVTERVASRVLSLPIFPELQERQIEFVCQSLADVLSD